MAKKMLKKRNALGRGLSALLSDADTGNEEAAKSILHTIAEIPIDAIQFNPFQPRKDFAEDALEELADSIKIQGIIQPITVRKLDGQSFQLISGERRLRASRRAQLTSIPAYVRLANDQQMLEMAIIENVQREDLNAIEIAFSYQRLISECQLKQEELGDRVGKKRSTVTNYLRLLRLPPDIQAGIRDEKISMGHARCLVNIENVDHQLNIYNRILKEGLSVRKVEEIVRGLVEGSTPKKTTNTSIPDQITQEVQHLQRDLSSYLGTKVLVKPSDKEKGEIKIPYHSTEDLNRILELIKK